MNPGWRGGWGFAPPRPDESFKVELMDGVGGRGEQERGGAM